MSDPLTVLTESLGGSPLAGAIMAGDAAAWVAPRPSDGRAWRTRAAETRRRFDARWLDALAPAFDAHGPAAERLRAAAADGVLVTTGQQAGLFGGPIYTWAKAMSALALADALQDACGMPVAPVFWAATDDADFAEAAATWVAMPGGAVPLTLAPTAPAGTIMAATPVGDVAPVLAALEAAARSAPYGEALIAVREAYPLAAGPPPTVGGSFVALLRQLLEPLGIAVLDAAHDAVRRRADPVLRQALEHAGAIDDALWERDRQLRAAGYDPQVALVRGLSLVFRIALNQRVRVPLAAAQAAAASAAPGTLSPSVLLRPVLEQALLPTIAYVAGPGELAYGAQSTAVAAAMRLAAPIMVPRWSGTIVEPHVAKGLREHGLTIEDLRDPHAAERRLLHKHLPAGVRAALEAIGAGIDTGLEALRRADGADLVPPATIDWTRGTMRYRLGRLERRFRAALRDEHRATLFDIATLRGALFPGGTRQERRLNLIPTLARQGAALWTAMRAPAAAHAAALVGQLTAEQ